ncbi:transcription antitermination factor NusB [Nereida sp. MMG025]|uniref:RsmB/NOP family class I SAM-dependent RNA methyltransferase n=1 Tax=Nereida sp. MMG025 TaxID=2909981 RepID=UPI00351D06A4|nr:RsmB/NOP family class I SAM-dependent RNA methyltransferase [Nereida sp. MMG025]
MADTGLPARRAALKLIEGVCSEGRLIPEMIGGLDHLSAPDRARAQRLALQTLRHLDKCDRVLKPYLKKTPPDLVMNILRLGVVELCEDGAAAHGVVNSGVTLASKLPRVGHMKGMVNAVLRKVAAEGPGAWAKAPASRIPNWLRGPLMQAWGRKAVETMEAVAAQTPPLDITAKGAPPEGAVALPTGSYRLAQYSQVTKLDGYASGAWWVQDAAAALPVQVLAPQSGEDVLDLCAAPGGKTLQLAAAGAKVTAVDDNANRMQRVTENLLRTGLKAKTVVQDALTFEGQFDAVLLDAPCSATGTMRRHPDLPHAKDGSDFGALIQLQAKMLRHAMTLVKPGGRLVFCTCSLLPDEGEVHIDELELPSDWHIDADACRLAGVQDHWLTSEGGLRLRPDYWADTGGMDGFYIACLRRAA